MIHLLHETATEKQLTDMLEAHGTFMKVAVDVRRGVLAGGGEFHADCESVLIDDGSQKDDVWGADWVPAEKTMRFGALINLKPRVNRSMEIQDLAIRRRVEEITRRLLERP